MLCDVLYVMIHLQKMATVNGRCATVKHGQILTKFRGVLVKVRNIYFY